MILTPDETKRLHDARATLDEGRVALGRVYKALDAGEYRRARELLGSLFADVRWVQEQITPLATRQKRETP